MTLQSRFCAGALRSRTGIHGMGARTSGTWLRATTGASASTNLEPQTSDSALMTLSPPSGWRVQRSHPCRRLAYFAARLPIEESDTRQLARKNSR
jgi:hypothetical protein